MSLILEALNRAEQERKHQQQVPDIHTQHQPPQAPRPWLPWALAGALLSLVILAALGWYLLDSSPVSLPGQPASGQTAAPATEPKPQPQSQPDMVPVVAAVEAPPADPVPAPSSAPLAAEAAAPAEQAAEVQQLYAPPPAEPVVEPAQVAQLYQPEPTQEIREQPWPEAAVQEGAEPDTAMAQPVERVGSGLAPRPELPARYLSSITDLPYFNDLPWLQKQQIPTISYSRHNYLANGISSVVINGETRGVGNLVSSGQFIVEDILADGVVLRYEHRRFKLPALTGWVNM